MFKLFGFPPPSGTALKLRDFGVQIFQIWQAQVQSNSNFIAGVGVRWRSFQPTTVQKVNSWVRISATAENFRKKRFSIISHTYFF